MNLPRAAAGTAASRLVAYAVALATATIIARALCPGARGPYAPRRAVVRRPDGRPSDVAPGTAKGLDEPPFRVTPPAEHVDVGVRDQLRSHGVEKLA